jgi:hypothetical protein
MGIFGFLSKAHSDAGLVGGDVQAKIAVYDEKIKTAKDNIDANRKALKQMDEAVDQVMGRSADEKGADKAVALRRAQQKERARLQSEIAAEQKTVSVLAEERAPIAAEVRKVEAEVGPIKYIANFIYGDNPDANVLEKAVTWVIIIIVIVFDPLAVILLLASQYSFQWFRQAKEEESVTPAYEPDDGPLTEDQVEQIIETTLDNPHPPGWMFDNTAKEPMKFVDPGEHPADNLEAELEEPKPVAEEKSIFETHPYLLKPFNHFTDTTPIVHKPEESVIEPIIEDTEKIAKQHWKSENPDNTIKHQERLYELGMIDKLPWEVVEKLDEQAASETEDSKKKSSYMIKDQDQQVKKDKE